MLVDQRGRAGRVPRLLDDGRAAVHQYAHAGLAQDRQGRAVRKLAHTRCDIGTARRLHADDVGAHGQHVHDAE